MPCQPAEPQNLLNSPDFSTGCGSSPVCRWPIAEWR